MKGARHVLIKTLVCSAERWSAGRNLQTDSVSHPLGIL